MRAQQREAERQAEQLFQTLLAVINIGPEGVCVEPVVDATKIALAFFTTLGSMLFMLGKMRRASRG